MARTFTPEVSMPSAMVAILALSPSAFWMSHSMPAASQAAVMSGRSKASQRADDFESGRMKPTLPPAAASAAAATVVSAAAAVSTGASVSTGAAVSTGASVSTGATVVSAESLSLPQPAATRASAEKSSAARLVVLVIW